MALHPIDIDYVQVFRYAPPIPTIDPKMDAPGVQGLFDLGNILAAGALAVAVITVIIGVVLAAVGPRLGFQHARSVGVGGIIGGLSVGAVLAIATPAIGTIWDAFA